MTLFKSKSGTEEPQFIVAASQMFDDGTEYTVALFDAGTREEALAAFAAALARKGPDRYAAHADERLRVVSTDEYQEIVLRPAAHMAFVHAEDERIARLYGIGVDEVTS